MSWGHNTLQTKNDTQGGGYAIELSKVKESIYSLSFWWGCVKQFGNHVATRLLWWLGDHVWMKSIFQFHTGDNFSQSRSAGLYKASIQTTLALWLK